MDILETHAFDRRQRRNTSCALFLSLLPFFLAAAAFFYLRPSDTPESLLAACVKTAPTVLLALVVLSWNGGQSVLGVAGGLLFSAVGDFCLVWHETFLHGMVAFAAAHLLYSLTFLSSRYIAYSSPSWLRLFYAILALIGAGLYVYLYPFLQRAPDGEILAPAVGVYIFLIVLMASLAIRARRAATILGSLSFMASDAALALQQFKVVAPVEHGHMFVMVTYYLAQLLIAVGDVTAAESTDDFAKWKRS